MTGGENMEHIKRQKKVRTDLNKDDADSLYVYDEDGGYGDTIRDDTGIICDDEFDDKNMQD